MNKKISVLLTCILITVLLAVGCGSSNNSDTAASADSNEAASVDEKDDTDVSDEPDASDDVDDTDDVQEEDSSADKKGDGTVHFYIVRHGKTMLNTTDRVQGWSDAVLTPAGEEVVGYAAKGMKVKDLSFDVAYSSDSGRSIQTANIILETLGQADLHLNTDWRLREFNFGTYEGDLNHTMWTDIAESLGMTLEEWMEDGVNPEEFANSVAKLDEGRDEEGLNWPAEDYDTITARLSESLNEIAEEVSSQGGGNVLLVSHGLSIGAMMDVLKDDGDEISAGIANASVSTVDYKDGKFTILEYGDTSYIEEGEKSQ